MDAQNLEIFFKRQPHDAFSARCFTQTATHPLTTLSFFKIKKGVHRHLLTLTLKK